MFADSRNSIALLVAAMFLLGQQMLPFHWTGNEIIYFDLAYRTVAPEQFTDAHAMFEGSNIRFLSMATIGYGIEILGYETAKTVFALLCLSLMSVGIMLIARQFGLRVIEVSVALLVFLVANQDLVGDEWMFGSVETKVLAYTCMLFALAAVLQGRVYWALPFFLVGTYFHLLVGGAWTCLLLLYTWMNRSPRRVVLRSFLIYVALLLPLIWLIVTERVLSDIDTDVFTLSVHEIYAVISQPFHAAPFANGMYAFSTDWAPGFMMHGALVVVFLYLAAQDPDADRPLLRWLAVLNGLLLVAMVVAYLDRGTHYFGRLLIFRPSSMVFFLSCLVLARCLVLFPSGPTRGAALLLVGAFIIPDYLRDGWRAFDQFPWNARLEAQMTPPQRDVQRWMIAETSSDASFLLEPSLKGIKNNSSAFTLGIERLTKRPMIIESKNVPSGQEAFVKWYSLLLARQAFFDGDCGQLSVLQADYVIFRNGFDAQPKLTDCTAPVYNNGTFTVAKIN